MVEIFFAHYCIIFSEYGNIERVVGNVSWKYLYEFEKANIGERLRYQEG